MTASSRIFREYDYLTEIPGFDPVTTSAQVVVPLLIEKFRPRTVLDLGCGTGIWLNVFRQHGVLEVRGCDGSWVPKDKLKIPAECFRMVDFHREWPVVERFDLATCLEVAEHVAAEDSVRLVEFLCASSDLVLWSAAIPGQGGHSHVNERYQDHWVEIFRRHGFDAFDLVRPAVWTDRRVSVWYRQNCLVFSNRAGQAAHKLVPQPFVAAVVHPELFERDRDPKNYSLSTVIRHLPYYIKRRFLGR